MSEFYRSSRTRGAALAAATVLAMQGCSTDRGESSVIDCTSVPGGSVSRTFDTADTSNSYGPRFSIGDAAVHVDGEVDWKTKIDVYDDTPLRFSLAIGELSLMYTRAEVQSANSGFFTAYDNDGSKVLFTAPQSENPRHALVTITYQCPASSPA